MDSLNESYWHSQWHIDYELHSRLGIKNVTQISKKDENVSIYADTDSLFVSFEPAIKHCEWQNLVVNKLDSLTKSFIFLEYRQESKISNSNCIGHFRSVNDFKDFLPQTRYKI